jgi:hypothetical protein
MASTFIVRFNEWFFTRRDCEGNVLGTRYPGRARGMGYNAAFDIAQSLREIGWTDATVCIPNGQAAAPEDAIISQHDLQQMQEFTQAWGDDPKIETTAATETQAKAS